MLTISNAAKNLIKSLIACWLCHLLLCVTCTVIYQVATGKGSDAQCFNSIRSLNRDVSTIQFRVVKLFVLHSIKSKSIFTIGEHAVYHSMQMTKTSSPRRSLAWIIECSIRKK